MSIHRVSPVVQLSDMGWVMRAQADVAVLDEIDSGLDIDALRDVADAVNGLKRPDSATLMVTHYKACPSSCMPSTPGGFAACALFCFPAL